MISPSDLGDVLVRKDLLKGGAAGEGPDCYVVMTAACDLVRKDGAKRVLLLSGTVTEISPKSWTYGKSNFKTPIMKLPGEEVRIPTKPAMHSNRKPATYSDLKPAGVPI